MMRDTEEQHRVPSGAGDRRAGDPVTGRGQGPPVWTGGPSGSTLAERGHPGGGSEVQAQEEVDDEDRGPVPARLRLQFQDDSIT